ncbi:hypothetical protein LX69_02595 [Breznakibacter xylanolyticus]|uniref:Uncharacterized protein n=1 Tax=Breznakibacter xylanolyticus TaxID=990 RepID=A0A2W7NQI1_9BACT|nr:hypothetical protein [Breznakibacter xylanolyticus]MBN2744437.1 hypothetical protein [Marinilabiliaceae bacterium]PZX13562.1 hypothetical protein LX69_02595 [Breznakibacter xylanolyticus]
MKHTIITTLLIIITLTGCIDYEEGTIRVQNKVHNVALQSINWGEYGIYDYVMTGETSAKRTISDEKENWPKTFQLEFYMTANGNLVYLKTRNKYTLNYNEDLIITISDTTDVYNPALE